MVTGKVTEIETGDPISMASVFIANTTAGTTTDKDGNYQLKLPGQGSYELIVSHVGYEMVSKKIAISGTLIKLDVSLNVHEIDEVVVSKTIEVRERDVELFWERLLGEPPSPTGIFAANKEDLFFHYNRETRTLKVSCQKPIRIINMVAGYQINFVLQSFEHNYPTDQSSWSGKYFFTELKPSHYQQENVWKYNRAMIYKSSLTHFIRALYRGTLSEEGFMLNYIRGFYDNSNKIVRVKNLSYLENTSSFLFSDSIENVKMLWVHPDSMLLLTCFGKQITDKEKSSQAKYMTRKGVSAKSKIHRNLIGTAKDSIYIFPDGTYLNYLTVVPFNFSPTITGLNMMLPIEYGMDPGSMTRFAQRPSGRQPFTIIPEIDSLMQYRYPEKLYLTTDRSCYMAGDTLWLSAWALNGGTLESTDQSRMLHVELIAPDNRIVRHVVLDIQQGLAFGQFTLPAGMVSDGLYRLRTYTRWSLNFGENYRFEKIIPIVQFKENIWKGPRKHETKKYEWLRLPNGKYGWAKKTDDQPKSNSHKTGLPVDSLPSIDLQFLPEGGRWIAGLPARMAFKAVAADGKGVNVTGEIIDDQGVPVASFSTRHRGMGSVFLTPQTGRTYSAKLFTGHLFDLPVPDTAGVAMSVFRKTQDTLEVHLYFTPELVKAKAGFRLLATSRGIPSGEWTVQAIRPRIVMHIPETDFPSGILRLTLFTSGEAPCNERMLFVDRRDGIGFELTPEPIGSGQAKVHIRAKDGNNFPVQGVFTVTVTDTLAGYRAGDHNLYSQMLLSSDLKGTVEDPGWYFTRQGDSSVVAALDLVMQTHGWGGYSWDEVTRAGKTFRYEPQKDYTISGTVLNLLNKPVKSIPVTLFGQGAETVIADTVTGADGKFIFKGLLPSENTLISVIAKHKKGKKSGIGLGIELDPQPDTPSPAIASLVGYGDSELWNSLADQYRTRKLDEDREMERLLDSLRRNKDIHFIEEVTITGVRPVKGSFNLNGPGMADRVLYEEDIARYDRYDRLLDIIKAEFPQLTKSSWKNNGLLWMLNKPWPFENQLSGDEKQEINQRQIQYDYPIWQINNKPVIFVLNGRVLPVSLPSDDSLVLHAHPATDELIMLAKEFWNISAKEITGIELMNSVQYIRAYGMDKRVLYYDDILYGILSGFICNNNIKYHVECGELQQYTHQKSIDEKYSPVIVEVTTRSGSVNLERIRVGTAKVRLHGFTVPRQFYTPKYYPENMIDQATYDLKPTLYWNPEVITDRDGKAEITVPIGIQKRNLQIKVEGTDLRGGIGNMVQEIVIEKK